MGAKQSQSPHYRSCSESNGSPSDESQPSTSDGVHRRSRPRNFGASRNSAPQGGVPGAAVSSRSTPDDDDAFITVDNLFRNLMATSLPMRFLQINTVKCPLCSRSMTSEQFELHIVQCYQKPRINYNEEVLTEEKDVECAICLDTYETNQVIARLPCLCIYHKSCIDSWFRKNRSCPQHPVD